MKSEKFKRLQSVTRPVKFLILNSYFLLFCASAALADPNTRVLNANDKDGNRVPLLVQPKQYSKTPSTFTPATTDATVFTLAAGEVGFIQNLSADAPLAVKKGASASTSSFSFILAAGTATDDGKGGAVKIDDWVGVVSVAKITGTGRYIAWKVSP